jgi:hypothetical protein
VEKCLLLSARQYDFKNDAGEHVAGITLNYLTLDAPLGGNTLGCPPLTINAPADLWPHLGELPGYYDMDFRQRPGPKGKPVLMVTGVRFVDALRFAGNAPSIA